MSAPSTTNRLERLRNRFPLVSGIVVGTIAYIVGYVSTFTLLILDGEFDFETVTEAGISQLDWAGWFFYSSHFARIEYTEYPDSLDGGEGELGVATTNLLAGDSILQLPELLFYLVPIVVLLSAGAVLAWKTTREAEPDEVSGYVGAAVVVGYLPLAVLGTVLFDATYEVFDVELSQAPELFSSILLVGCIYPVFFGTIGAAIFIHFVTGDSPTGP